MSIYGRIAEKSPEACSHPILMYAEENSARQMKQRCEKVINPRLDRIKATQETLKLSAAVAGVYSLSAIQLGLPICMLTIHKAVPNGSWFCDEVAKNNNEEAELNANDEEEDEDAEDKYLLDPNDFKIFMNPKILNETSAQEYQWEYCLSYPYIRCMVKRPLGIHVWYLNEEGIEMEQKLYDFQARLFLHELDHLEKRTEKQWSLYAGNIDVLRYPPEEQSKVMSTVQYYSRKLEQKLPVLPSGFDNETEYD